jgi:glutathione S-transferase
VVLCKGVVLCSAAVDVAVLAEAGESIMPATPQIVLYHSPQTRSSAVRILLEELGAPHHLHLLNMKAGENRQPAYLAINPMGKVPAITDNGMLVTEQVAIMIHLADRFPKAGLAPAIDDPLRGPYLRWMVYYAACLEPAVVDMATKREPAPVSISPYGDYDTVILTLANQLRKGPYILGEKFTAADVLWGSALTWMTGWKLVPDVPEITAYVERLSARPSVVKVKASDEELAAQHAAVAG